MTAIPLAPLPDDIAANVAQLGAKQVNLYRCLAHAPELLRAWINFAWALRGHETTERRLRELMILRTAALHHSPYEWHQHRRMAAEAGATDYEVAELEMWRTSAAFSDADRAALAFTDAIVARRGPARGHRGADAALRRRPARRADRHRRVLLDGAAGARRARRPDRGAGPTARLIRARYWPAMVFAPPARHLLRAKDLADARFFEPLDVDDMARAAGLSRAHFSREFRRAFGESPHAYLLTRRLERAASLLRHDRPLGRGRLLLRRAAERRLLHHELHAHLRRVADRLPRDSSRPRPPTRSSPPAWCAPTAARNAARFEKTARPPRVSLVGDHSVDQGEPR